ncbi:hypothetical protein CPB85DRAFT_1218554 [Mucidula mucida]|nr:hypothetical protein CPB85DRAFT_1218554 [Mucidula mucida]
MPAPETSHGLKRRASFDATEDDAIRPKRRKETDTATEEEAIAASLQTSTSGAAVDGVAFTEELAEELQCGCCSELVYRPVVVNPCQHFFCGSCCVLWIRNGGSNCPACRGNSTSVTPSRPLQAIVNVLLRAVPSKMRAERERAQADAIYPKDVAMRIPPPREPSPPPNLNPSDFARPCPHCTPGNAFGYVCPQPIADPTTDVEHAWPLDDGAPPGHLNCGNWQSLLAINAPNTTRCDFCHVSFCGINVPGRCLAINLMSQYPQGLADLSDLIQSSDIYDCFNSNTIEVDLLFDYLTSRQLTPRHIYREIVIHIQSQPLKFQPLIDQDIFADSNQVAPGVDPDPSAERRRICRMCATEVLFYGLKDWWVRVRSLDPSRKDCPEGGSCTRQKDLGMCPRFLRRNAMLILVHCSPRQGV